MANVLEHEDLELEMICPHCFMGKSLRDDSKCQACAGTGRTTTAFGDAILEFVRKHLDAAEGKAK